MVICGGLPRMAVRMKDIAEDLGLSVITVSKALRNRPDISASTRLRVLRRSEELNYRPNLSARALVTGRTNMMGLVIPDLAHAFFSELARGLAGVLRNAGITLLIASSEQHADLEKQIIDQFIARRVDALLIASTQLEPQTFQQLKAEGIPHILLDRKFDGFPSHFVGVNDEYLGYLATKHLIDIGCRRIAHISTVKLSQVAGRLSGYKRALAEHGLSLGPEFVNSTTSVDGIGPAAGHTAAKELLRLTPRPDAIFCYNDLVAMGAMQAILEEGLRIPADLALIGCGNVYLADYAQVPLSSVDQQSTAIGVRAGQLAVDLVTAQKNLRPKTILLEPKLIQRASTRR
jgi:LacI family transcriptional regulator